MFFSKKYIFAFFSLVFITGCATATPKKSAEESKPIVEQPLEKPVVKPAPQLQNVKQEALKNYEQKKGVIFAKTELEGVLMSREVKLFFKSLENEKETFQLPIQTAPQTDANNPEPRRVNPDYFYIELPVGKYVISSFSTPVGTTSAVEPLNVSFDVVPDGITYIGTLKITGIKEKIKLGGVPYIKPGFEYQAQVLDQSDEGIQNFREKYPEIKSAINIHLMQIQPM